MEIILQFYVLNMFSRITFEKIFFEILKNIFWNVKFIFWKMFSINKFWKNIFQKLFNYKCTEHFSYFSISDGCRLKIERCRKFLPLYNSVLLWNKAACRSKLGPFDKPMDDCTLALSDSSLTSIRTSWLPALL